MNQAWFEMNDLLRVDFQRKVWLPLRSFHKVHEKGEFGCPGYKEEIHGVGSLAIPTNIKDKTNDLGWSQVGISHDHIGYFSNGQYTPADTYNDYHNNLIGINLVLEQRINSIEGEEWHLHQDLVVTLGLIREGDIWLCPDEGYIEIAKLHKSSNDNLEIFEFRAEHLKDYLCARDMGLYLTTYYSRTVITEDASFIDWENGHKEKSGEQFKWIGNVSEIHEGGYPYGKKMAIIHVSRTDVNDDEDLPNISSLPTDENVKSASHEECFEGRKIFRVSGELWRNVWIDPAELSPRVKGDETPVSIFFLVDEKGSQLGKDKLIESGSWLWFKPDVMMALAHRRGGSIQWYSRDTGKVSCIPDHGVHFGINDIGLINVYAKDIALLPDWQQRIWAGFNVSPEGGVSKELIASQVRAEPAETQSPEKYLGSGLNRLKFLGKSVLGIDICRDHSAIPELLKKTHRFRAINESGLFAMAKDLARLTADNFDASEIQKIISPPKGKNWKSLKSLENLIAMRVGEERAREIMGPLFGVYELRHVDAHLPSSEIDEIFQLLDVDRSQLPIFQGYQILHSCVSSIYAITSILERWHQ